MSDFTRFWLHTNKKHIIIGIIAAAFFTLLGGGSFIALAFYAVSVAVCAMNCMMVLWYGGSDGSALDCVLSLPFRRTDIFDTCVKMMLVQSGVYAAIYAAGTAALNNISGAGRILPLMGANIHEMPLTALAYYLFAAGLFMIVLTVLVSMVISYGAVKKSMLFVFIIYIAPVNFMIYAAYAAILAQTGRYRILSAAIGVVLAAAVFATMICIFVHEVKKARRIFVTGSL